MKTVLTFTVLSLSLVLFGCKKMSTPAPAGSTQMTSSSDYDNANKIFRVKASSSGVPYTITIKRTNPANPNATDVQQGNQSTGNPFEYPFSPNIGDKIEITAQSDKGSVYVYALYKGTPLSGVNTQTTSTGGTLVTFTYDVTN